MRFKKIFDYIMESNGKEIIVIDGPSGCGKTTLLNKIRDETSKTFKKLSIEQFTEVLLEYLNKKISVSKLASDSRICADIVCIEDIDVVLSNKLESSFCLAEVATNLTEKGAVVILTGIDLNKRMTRDFFARLNGPQYLYLDKEE